MSEMYFEEICKGEIGKDQQQNQKYGSDENDEDFINAERDETIFTTNFLIKTSNMISKSKKKTHKKLENEFPKLEINKNVDRPCKNSYFNKLDLGQMKFSETDLYSEMTTEKETKQKIKNVKIFYSG